MTAAITAAVIGAGAGIYMNSQNKGGAQGGVAQVDNTMHGYNLPLRNNAASYAQNAMRNLEQGEAPLWWQKNAPTVKAGLVSDLKDTYYGTPGTRNGLINQAMSAGAMTGLRGKAAYSPAKTQIMEYGKKRSLVDQFMAQQGMNIMQNQESTILQAINGMPQGPGSQAVPWQSGGGGGNDFSGALGSLTGQAFDYFQQNPMGKQSTVTPTSNNYKVDYSSSGYNPGGLTSAFNSQYNNF